MRFAQSRKVKLIAIAVIAIVAYLSSYAILRSFGRYHWSQSGKLRYNDGAGLSVTDVEIWHPRWAYWEPFRNIYGKDGSRGNVPGYFYSPLIRMDRHFFHPTVNFFDQL
jgi:hypothetical protein